ncbi:MAG: MerR family transcriptional regulator [Prevotellaceae bacterium]|nr:MerR family transcriptional regulator [Prevotellaceae bacterium]
MALKTDKNLKVYYTTKEVALMFGVNESLLRYWETVFPSIRPKTIGNNVRQYSEKNIEEIRVVYNLVKVRGFKLDAAAEMLKNNRAGVDKTSEIINRLTNVRDELTLLKTQFDNISKVHAKKM